MALVNETWTWAERWSTSTILRLDGRGLYRMPLHTMKGTQCMLSCQFLAGEDDMAIILTLSMYQSLSMWHLYKILFKASDSELLGSPLDLLPNDCAFFKGHVSAYSLQFSSLQTSVCDKCYLPIKGILHSLQHLWCSLQRTPKISHNSPKPHLIGSQKSIHQYSSIAVPKGLSRPTKNLRILWWTRTLTQ